MVFNLSYNGRHWTADEKTATRLKDAGWEDLVEKRNGVYLVDQLLVDILGTTFTENDIQYCISEVAYVRGLLFKPFI